MAEYPRNFYTFVLCFLKNGHSKMRFTKMHGLGNDYIYIDCMDGSFGGDDSSIINDNARLEEISARLSNRHLGIGGDGIVMILPSSIADFRMRIFNADGSEARMCGNASRCIGKYVYDNKLTTSTDITLETASGVKYLHLTVADGEVESVTVDMGEPDFVPATIPVIPGVDGGNVDIPVTLSSGKGCRLTAVSMGNPHGVMFVDDLATVDVHGVGAELERHAMWPDRANIEFAQVVSPSEIVMRVWERGSGETMACGTGSCATAVAAALTGRTNREVTIKLLGGDLKIRWDENSNHVFMTGTATTVFVGEVAL
jgi:diaminopimelate epimerase